MGHASLTSEPLFASVLTAVQDVAEFDGLSTLWVLLAAILVFFMQAGFSVLEAGLVRTKNAGNVLMKNLLDFCFAVLAYFLFGYAIMYGSEGLRKSTGSSKASTRSQRSMASPPRCAEA